MIWQRLKREVQAEKPEAPSQADATALGLQVPAGWKQLPYPERTQRNLAMLDQHLISWEAFAQESVQPGHCMIFMHVPKSGGTTLQHILSKNYPSNSSVHVNAPILERNVQVLYREPGFPRLVMGHYQLWTTVYQLIDRPLVHLTLLREPVARVLSHFNAKTEQGLTSASIEEFVESRQVIDVYNGQTLRLAGLLKRKVVEQGLVDETGVLSLAKKNLLNRFTFFGITENFTEFLLMGKKLLGWKEVFHEKKNVSTKTVQMKSLDKRTLDIIRNSNRLDLELHEFARKVFQERCETLGIGARSIDRFKRLNHAYTKLLADDLKLP